MAAQHLIELKARWASVSFVQNTQLMRINASLADQGLNGDDVERLPHRRVTHLRVMHRTVGYMNSSQPPSLFSHTTTYTLLRLCFAPRPLAS